MDRRFHSAPKGSAEQVITVVSGLPRSGTSLMMQMLAAGGLEPLTDGQRAADASNPRGYFEWEKVKTLPQQPDCIAEAEGKAVKVISSLLPSLPGAFHYKVIFLERSLTEVVASQACMIQKLGAPAPALTPEAMERALHAHLKQLKAALRSRREMSILWVEHQDVLRDPQRVCEGLQSFLAVALNLPAMIAQVDSSLYRQREANLLPDRRLDVSV
jgi:hypothetical protein